MDSRGGAVALWGGSIRSMLEWSERAAGGSWSPAAPLGAAGRFRVSSASIAIDARDRALAIWAAGNHGREAVLSASRPVGGRWSAPVAVSRVEPGVFQVDVAVNRQGEAVVAWWTQDLALGGPVLRAASRGVDGRFTDPTTIARAGWSFPGELDAAIDERGRALIALTARSRAGQIRVYTVERAPRGHWSTPTPRSGPHERAGQPRIALSARGDALVAWTTRAGALLTVSRDWRGRWGAPSRPPLQPKASGGLELAMTPRGEALVAWSEIDGRTGRLLAGSRGPDGRWGAPAQVAAAPALTQRIPKPFGGTTTERTYSPFLTVALHVLPTGDVTAVWERGAPDSENFASSQTAESATLSEGRWQSPVAITEPRPLRHGLAALAFGPHGTATALWMLQGSSRTRIEASERR
jgi:hypothetical protein